MDYTFQMTLEKWLELATQDLVPDAQARIRTEIETHYADAFAAAREAGRSETDADREALAALGDPYAAWHRFRRTYLQENEAQELEKIRLSYAMSRRKLFKLASMNAALLLLLVFLSFWSIRHHAMDFAMRWVLIWVGYLLGKASNKLLVHLHARLLFDPKLKNADQLYMRWVVPIQTFVFCLITGLVILALNADHPGERARIICSVILMVLLLNGLTSHFSRFHSLLRKVRGFPSSSSKIGPGQHA